MDVKAKLEEYLAEEDLLYINIFTEYGGDFHLVKPLDIGTLNLELQDDYFSICGIVNTNNRMDTSIPYSKVIYVNAMFGTEENIIVDAEGNTITNGDV